MKRVKLFILVIVIVMFGAGCAMENLKSGNEKSSTLTLKVNWDEAVANESTNKVIEDAITKGYKVYAGIIKSSEVDKSGTINFKEKQEISYRTNKNVVFTIQEADYTKYHICIFIDKDGDDILSSWNHETIAYSYSVTINAISQINMPIKITPETSSSTLTFNVTWNQVVSNKGVEQSVIDEAITKGYKLYLGILKESEITKDDVVRCKIKQEIEYNKNREVIFIINEADYTKYQVYIYIDKNGNGFGDGLEGETIAGLLDTITVNSTSQIVDFPVEISNVQAVKSSTLTFNINWQEVVLKKEVEESVINEAISKGYKAYIGIIKNSEMVKGGIVKCTQQQEIEYKTNSSINFTINEADYTEYQAYIYIDKDGDKNYDITGFEAIAGKLNITVNAISQRVDMPVEVSNVQAVDSSTLKFNITWNQAVSNGEEKSLIDEAVSKGYKVYIGIAKKLDVTRSGIFKFYEKREIEYYLNKNVEFTIPKADYGIYTLALFIDRNGDGGDHWMDDLDMINHKDINVTAVSQKVDVAVNIN